MKGPSIYLLHIFTTTLLFYNSYLSYIIAGNNSIKKAVKSGCDGARLTVFLEEETVIF